MKRVDLVKLEKAVRFRYPNRSNLFIKLFMFRLIVLIYAPTIIIHPIDSVKDLWNRFDRFFYYKVKRPFLIEPYMGISHWLFMKAVVFPNFRPKDDMLSKIIRCFYRIDYEGIEKGRLIHNKGIYRSIRGKDKITYFSLFRINEHSSRT